MVMSDLEEKLGKWKRMAKCTTYLLSLSNYLAFLDFLEVAVFLVVMVTNR